MSISAAVLWITKQTKDHEKHEPLSRLSLPFVSFVVQTFHHPNLLLRQPVQLIHQRVNLCIESLDPPRQVMTAVLFQCLGLGVLLLQPQHLIHQRHYHPVMSGHVLRVVEVNPA